MMELLQDKVQRSSKMRVLELPAELCARAESKFGEQFASVSDLLIFVLDELLCEHAFQLDRSEQALVEERLRELGYI